MHYVYVLRSLKDKAMYIGSTNDLKRGVHEHNAGMSFATRPRGIFKLAYDEVHPSRKSAEVRERYLKTGWGRSYLRKVFAFSREAKS
jgi:putative endonuclease